MAEVDRRVESYLAHLPEVRAEVRKLAEDRMARMVAVAATHNDSGEFASSFRIVQGATDALIVSNDPNALSKNYGHTAANGRFVEGVHAFEAGIS